MYTITLLHSSTFTFINKYCIMQRYINEITAGGKRVMLIGGEVCGGYTKKHSSTDHRANFIQEASEQALELSNDEFKACQALAQKLFKHGLNFVGIDMSYPYLLELNIVNPGGIGTDYVFTNNNKAKHAVDLLFKNVFNNRITD